MTAAENATPGVGRLPGPLERRCCGAPNSGVCHQYGLCVAYGAHPATPPPVGTERDQQADELCAACGLSGREHDLSRVDGVRHRLIAPSPPAPVPDTVVRERAARWLHEQYGEHTQPGSTRVTSLLAALCPAPAPEVAALVEQLTELETGYRSGELNGSEFAHDVLPLLAALLTVLGGGKDA